MRTFHYESTKSPDFFEENREAPHSDHEARTAGGGSFRLSLNGNWQFRYAEAPAAVPAGFQDPAFDCRGWDTIPVPAHIQLHGYGRPQYVNVQYPWDGTEDLTPGQIPAHNPVGCYVKAFELPEIFAGQPVYISFQGAESGLAVWLNGQYVGYGEDGFTPSEFELTPYLRPGENKLAVEVFQFTSASWCEDQDFFRFSGLFREVYLYTVPAAHIRDLKLVTELDGGFSCGTLHIAAQAQGAGTVDCVLFWEDTPVARSQAALGEEASLEVPSPRLWSAEAPNLYRLELTVRASDGQVTERITEQVGFRRFEIRDGLMLLNGKRIVFRGVNRHEFSAAAGRCVTEAETELDIQTMKRHNINAIRTSHYPNQSHLYRLCDRYGIYVIDEMNLESHGAWHMTATGRLPLEDLVPGDGPQWRDMVLSRAEAMYARDKNHPCVLIWSLGNESFGGRNLLAAARYFHRVDTRPVHYEGATMDRRHPELSDIFSNMYFPAEAIREALARDSSKPAISCEYGHAMGNSFGNMQRYIRLTDEVPAYQGGFIWDYIDQSLTKTDRYGQEFQAYGGDFDDRPSDFEFCGNGLVYGRDRSPSPKLQEVKYLYQSLQIQIRDGTARITNRFLFTPSSRFACVAQLYRAGMLQAEAPLETDIAPGGTALLALPLWPETLDTEYTVLVSFRLREDTLWAKAGHEIAFGQWTGGRIPAEAHPAEAPEVIDGVWNIGVRGRDFQLLFSKEQGGLISYRHGGRELLKAMPKPSFWRAPTDNDRGCFAQARFAQWKIASLYATARAIPAHIPGWGRDAAWRLEQGKNWVQVSFTYLLPTSPRTTCDVAYRVFADGTVEVTMTCDGARVLGPMPEFGLCLTMDADFHNLQWYGLGPEETYCDRQAGGKLGIYENQAADNLAAYLRPQECGNKTGVRWARVTDSQGTGLEFRGDAMEFSALPYTPHELENAAHVHELPPVYRTVIRAAMKQMGVAGDDSWGAMPAPEHLLPADTCTFRFSFRAICAGQNSDCKRP